MDSWYCILDGVLIIDVKAVPGASKTEFAGLAGNRLRIRIAAAPEEGRANGELVAFLAKKTACPKGSIQIISGEKSRLKRIQMPREALEKLLTLIG